MFKDLFSGWHLIIVLLVVVLLFGATRLPVFAKSLGQSMRIFRREMKNINKDDDDDAPSSESGTDTDKK